MQVLTAGARGCQTRHSAPSSLKESRILEAPRSEIAMTDVHVTTFQTAMGRMSVATTEAGVVACTLPGERRDKLRDWVVKHALIMASRPLAPYSECRHENSATLRLPKSPCRWFSTSSAAWQHGNFQSRRSVRCR